MILQTFTRARRIAARSSRSHSTSSMADSSKLKLLCLHGYTQNAEVFKSRIGSMRKGLKSRLEFSFVDAPFESTGLPGDEKESQGVETGGKSWWQWQDSGPTGRPSLAAHYTGWEQALDSLVQALREHRPDGILGFSQGATATALLLACLPAVKGQLEGVELPKFAIMVAGFLPRDPRYAAILESGRPSIPSLFVTGESDALVPWERTQALIDCFEPSCTSVYKHPGAHLVPTCSGQFKQTLVAFLDAVGPSGGSSSGSGCGEGAAEVGKLLQELKLADGSSGEQPGRGRTGDEAKQSAELSCAHEVVVVAQ